MANHQQRSWLKYPIQSFSTLRAAHFFFQMHALAQTTRWLPFVTNKTEPIKKSDIELLTQEVRQLIESDSENIANGIYPISVLKPEPFFKHIFRVPQIFWDGVQSSWPRVCQNTTYEIFIFKLMATCHLSRRTFTNIKSSFFSLEPLMQ